MEEKYLEVDAKLENMLNNLGFSIEHKFFEAPREGRFINCPKLHPKIMDYIQEKYKGKLYLHQGLAIEAALRGENVVQSTGTASGKTVGFALPVFNALLNNVESRAIFFYPTKALAGDQLKALQQMASNFALGDKIFRFDGDVDTSGRIKALQNGRILLCTPDVLHTTMLKRNNEVDYNTFFANLRFVILDECHIYSGAFGSNMAFVLRRLRQVCRRKGASLQFLAASATSRDPGKHMEMLTANKFTVIDEKDNGSPTGGRLLLMTGFTGDEQVGKISSLISKLVDNNHRFLAFCHTRRLTEQYYNELSQAYPKLQDRVMPYRSGYEPEDRQKIENALRDGKLCGVISTSALELGVDLPNMEYCLLLGLPATAMSFWQRVGRVGRHFGSQGRVLIFPSDNSLDDYYRNHPEKLYERPIEELAIHLDNRQLILSHFACARVESGNFDKPDLNEDIFGQDFVNLAESINNMDIVEDILTSNDPHSIVGIRGIDDPTYEIYTIGGEKRLGTITWSQVLKEAYPEAVYRHMGEAYRVERIINRDFLIKVKREKKTASTSPAGYISVKERTGMGGTIFRQAIWPNVLEMYHTTVAVITYTTGFKEKIGGNWVQKKYPTPLQRRVLTEGVWIKFLPQFGNLDKDGLNAFAHAVSNIYAIYTPCDTAEIATHSVCKKQDNFSLIYFFDTTSGGLGVSTGIFDTFFELLPLVEERLLNCDHCDLDNFDRGCPSCIQAPRWFEDNEHLSKQSALDILFRLKEICQEDKPQVSISSSYLHRTRGGFTSISDLSQDEIILDDRSFGRIIFTNGSVVIMRSGQKGIVINHFVDNENLFFILEMENGKHLRVRDMGLTLFKGEQRYLCLNCGNEELSKNLICPNCGSKLY